MKGYFLNLNSSEYKYLLYHGIIDYSSCYEDFINEAHGIPIYVYEKITKHILGPLELKAANKEKIFLSSLDNGGSFEKKIDYDCFSGLIDDEEEWFLRTLFSIPKKQTKFNIVEFTNDRSLDGFLWNRINISPGGIVTIRIPDYTTESEEKKLIDSISENCSLCFKTKRNTIKIIGLNFPISIMVCRGHCPSTQDDAFMEGFIEPDTMVKNRHPKSPISHEMDFIIVCNDDNYAVREYLDLKGIIYLESTKMKKKQYVLSNVSSTPFLNKIREINHHSPSAEKNTQFEISKRIIISIYITHLFERNGYSIVKKEIINKGEILTVVKESTQRVVVLWNNVMNESLSIATDIDANSAIILIDGCVYGAIRGNLKHNISNVYNLLSEDPYGFDNDIKIEVISSLQSKNSLLQLISEKYEV